jgi:anti-anti-sigma factor
MNIELSTAGGSMVLRLAGRFDFTTRNEFMARAGDAIAQAQASEIRIDMGAVEYIDSSALGMLLMMRDMVKKSGKSVSLVGARGIVRQVLDTAQFERLFTIH